MKILQKIMIASSKLILLSFSPSGRENVPDTGPYFPK